MINDGDIDDGNELFVFVRIFSNYTTRQQKEKQWGKTVIVFNENKFLPV